MAGPFHELPPGVYFNPTAEECVRDYLRPWQAGMRPATDRVITDVNIYSDSPVALVQGREPGFSRGADHKWLVLTDCVRVCGGKGGKARAKRDVVTGGNWKVEQRSKRVADDNDKDDAGDDDPPGGDRRRTNGFYVAGGGGSGKEGKKDPGLKTPWLMEELTTKEDEEASVTGWKGERTFKVFCKLYVSPRATNEEKLRIFGEDRVPFDRDGKPKTAREALPEDLFDAVAASVYRAQGSAPAPAPAPPRVLGGCQQGQPARRVIGHQHGQPAALLPAPAPRVLGLHQGVPAHQYGNTAATPVAILGHHHGHAVLPRGVPAYHQHGHGQAAPRQIHDGPGQHYDGPPGQYYAGPVHDPYHQFHEASTSVAAHYYSGQSFAYVDPQQQQGYDYEMIHMEKKPRLTLTYDESPPPPQQPEGETDSDKSSCVVQASTSQEQEGQCGDMDADTAKVLQEEAEHVAMPSPPQEVAAESTIEYSIFADLPPLIQDTLLPSEDDRPDLLMSKLPSSSIDGPPPQPGFDEFSLEDYDFPDFQLGSLDT